MEIKYKLTDETINFEGHALYRIKALIDIPKYGVKAGDLGGFVEHNKNLSQFDQCWVADNAKVYGNGHVCANSIIIQNACVFENATIFDSAKISYNARIFGDATIHGHACIYKAQIFGKISVLGESFIGGNIKMCGTDVISNVKIYDNDMITSS